GRNTENALPRARDCSRAHAEGSSLGCLARRLAAPRGPVHPRSATTGDRRFHARRHEAFRGTDPPYPRQARRRACDVTVAWASVRKCSLGRAGDIVRRMAQAALVGIALVLLAAACGGSRPVEKKPGVLVVILDPVRPDALDALSMPLEVTVRHQPGDLVGNYPLSHVDDPLVLLIRPGRYSIKVSAGCAGRFIVP